MGRNDAALLLLTDYDQELHSIADHLASMITGTNT